MAYLGAAYIRDCTVIKKLVISFNMFESDFIEYQTN